MCKSVLLHFVTRPGLQGTNMTRIGPGRTSDEVNVRSSLTAGMGRVQEPGVGSLEGCYLRQEGRQLQNR